MRESNGINIANISASYLSYHIKLTTEGQNLKLDLQVLIKFAMTVTYVLVYDLMRDLEIVICLIFSINVIS